MLRRLHPFYQQEFHGGSRAQLSRRLSNSPATAPKSWMRFTLSSSSLLFEIPLKHCVDTGESVYRVAAWGGAWQLLSEFYWVKGSKHKTQTVVQRTLLWDSEAIRWSHGSQLAKEWIAHSGFRRSWSPMWRSFSISGSFLQVQEKYHYS